MAATARPSTKMCCSFTKTQNPLRARTATPLLTPPPSPGTPGAQMLFQPMKSEDLDAWSIDS
eukprot:5018016-Pyramimonas_sp.AAC.1